ncbi:MAG: single-stranded-DNA-specific exonuclease RecJ [Dehalococcoidia bacterium]|nr:single-stranded-DNA-specific exonuclease RecJ [Dehalococcoidia bacterium]
MTAPVAVRPRARWRIRDPYAHQNGIAGWPRVVATVLAARGITTKAQAELFYKPHLQPDHDPLVLPGMTDAIERTRRAIRDKETVALYGDFDVDGVTSVAVLHTGLRPLGAKTINYIPDRFREGYGLNNGAIAYLHEQGVSLLVTADCGISSVDEVAFANTLGMDVIILDHHTVPETMPAAFAAVNPKRKDSPYPFDELAAVGVSYRFLQVLYEACGRTLDETQFLDLVALGTVVDVAPLEDENRRIVTRGIEQMQRGLRPGLEALAAVAGTPPERFNAETLGFALGPRMNAAGRLKHANLALELMLAEDLRTARPLAEELDRLNRERQQQTADACALAEELCGALDDPLIMVGSDQIHSGIVGLVAARLAEARHRPAIVYERGPETSRASCRSIPEFDIVGAIRKEKELLVRHGGHRAAAGFTVRNEDVDELRRRLVNTAAELLEGPQLQPVHEIDAETRLCDISGKDVAGLMRFEPCGQGNRKPVLLSRGVRLANSKTVGSDASHLKVTVKDGPLTFPGIAFRQAGAELAENVDIVYSLTREWRSERVELEILDIAPTNTRPLEYGA